MLNLTNPHSIEMRSQKFLSSTYRFLIWNHLNYEQKENKTISKLLRDTKIVFVVDIEWQKLHFYLSLLKGTHFSFLFLNRYKHTQTIITYFFITYLKCRNMELFLLYKTLLVSVIKWGAVQLKQISGSNYVVVCSRLLCRPQHLF